MLVATIDIVIGEILLLEQVISVIKITVYNVTMLCYTTLER